MNSQGCHITDLLRPPVADVKTLAREFAERATNGNPVTMAEPYELAWLREYGKVESVLSGVVATWG